MRIAQIAPPWFRVPPTGYGGVEAVVSDLADTLTARGHDVTLFAAGGSTAAGRVVTTFEQPPDAAMIGNTWVEAYHAISSFQELVGAGDFDVIHDHSGIVSAALGAFTLDEPLVTTLHNPWNDLSRACYSLLEDRVHVVTISESQRCDHPRLAGSTVIHNGIHVEQFPFQADKGDYLLHIGRSNPDKGTVGAIEVARRAGLPLVLVTKRKEPVEVAYWADVVAPRLHSGVEVCENIPFEEKVRLLGGARALVFPIRWREPFGLVMVEAMACGTPVLTTPFGAAPEIVVDGEHGFLRPSIDELVEALDRVAEIDPRACRDRVLRHFSREVMTMRYECLYDRLT